MKKKAHKKAGHSARLRINIWYTVLMTVLGAVLGVAFVLSQRYISTLNIRSNLMTQVETNADEVDYENGILEVENDFTYNQRGIASVVLAEDGRVLAGSYAAFVKDLSAAKLPDPGDSGEILSLELNGKRYCLLDKRVRFNVLCFTVDAATGEVLDWSSESRSDDATSPAPPQMLARAAVRNAYENALLFASLDENDCRLLFAREENLYDVPVVNLDIHCSEKLFDDVFVRGIAADEGNAFADRKSILLLSILLPVYLAIAAGIGYLISSRVFSGVGNLSRTVAQIRTTDDVRSVRAVSTDIRELEPLTDGFNRMLARLHQSFEAEKHFTDNASHELKTPIAVIHAQCELLIDSATLNEEDRKHVLRIQKQARAMSRLVGDLLMISRLEQGQEYFDFSVEDFSIVVRAVCEDAAVISDKKLILDVKDDVMMRMDVTLMTRLVENLISNADKYGRDGGSIWVTLDKRDGRAFLRVADDGIGIAPEEQEKIFQRFYRVDKARSREMRSSGLGLSFVDEICRLHGGRITVESTLGKGTVFTLEFQLADQKTQ